MRCVQFAVHDVAYPRNAMIRAELVKHGVQVEVVERTSSGGYLRRCWELYRKARGLNDVDLVLLSELSIQYAWIAWLVSRRLSAKLWVDWFVGMHETNVGDWDETGTCSVRALAYFAADRVSIALADLISTDTEPRALQISSVTRSEVYVIPVGAPNWAIPQSQASPSIDVIRVLFYGQLSPLHGMDSILDALSSLKLRGKNFSATLIVSGRLADSLAEQIALRGLVECRLKGPVPETELSHAIASADVVLGVFGTSRKAATVIPNKVWQSLCSGVPIVTRRSRAYDRYRADADRLLYEVDPHSPTEIAAAIIDAVGPDRSETARVSSALRVRSAFERDLTDAIGRILGEI